MTSVASFPPSTATTALPNTLIRSISSPTPRVPTGPTDASDTIASTTPWDGLPIRITSASATSTKVTSIAQAPPPLPSTYTFTETKLIPPTSSPGVPSPDSPPSINNVSNLGPAIGGAVAGTVVLCCVVFVIWYRFRKRQKAGDGEFGALMGDGFGKKVDSEMEITQRAELGEDKPIELPALEVVLEVPGEMVEVELPGEGVAVEAMGVEGKGNKAVVTEGEAGKYMVVADKK